MMSQKLKQNFGTPICIDSTDSEKEDIHNSNILCFHHPSYFFNRETYQMSPLLFESDTDDTSQSTEIKCYQEKMITQIPSNQQIFDMLSSFTELRNELTSQLDISSQHNECCSETLLNSTNHRTLNETKSNTHNAYISPSPRVTRSTLLNSRILTRSARRLHKVGDFSDNSRNSRKLRTKKDLNKRKKRSTDGNTHTNRKASENETTEEVVIESIRKSTAMVVLERLKDPLQDQGKFIQPNIVPNIQLHDTDNELDFLNRRPSSEVQICTDKPVVISISSDESAPPRLQCVSPDLFENYEDSSASNLCSQNSIDIPNGQVRFRSESRSIVEDTAKNEHNSTVVPSIFDLFNDEPNSPTAARNKLFDDEHLVENAFEITTNDVFGNVICIEDSETLTSQIANDIVDDDRKSPPAEKSPPATKSPPDQRSPSQTIKIRNTNSDHPIDLTKCTSSQEVTPKRRPEMRSIFKRSPRRREFNTSSTLTLNRTKWLSKPKSANLDGEVVNRTPYRCRRLDLWFQDSVNKTMPENNEGQKKNILLSSSEDDES